MKVERRGFLKLAASTIAASALEMAVPEIVRATALPDVMVEAAIKKEQEIRYLECPIEFWHEVWSRRTFEQHVYELRSNNYFPITLQRVEKNLRTGQQTWPKGTKPMILTFDDGLLSQHENAVPVLEDWKLNATFACMADWEGDRVHKYMTNKQIKELADKGFEIASHTFHHPNLVVERSSDNGNWQSEIVKSKKRLEEITGREIVSFVYPYGAYDLETAELVARHYKIAATIEGGPMLNSKDIYFLPRQRKS